MRQYWTSEVQTAINTSTVSSISVLVNGKSHLLDSPCTVSGLLERLELIGKRLAVELNGEIVPKGLHTTTPLSEGDQLEIVVAVGGG